MPLLDLLQLQIVAALFANLGNGDHTKLKAARLGVILYDLLAKSEHVKVKDMGITAVFAVVEAEEIKIPHREIACIQKAVVSAYGVVGDNERGLHHIDKIGLGISF